MNSNIQFSNFTHGKCTKCGYIAQLDKFEQTRINESVSPDVGFGTMEMYQLALRCPMCGDKFCEALFPNEVN